LRTWLAQHGIHTQIHYPVPIHRQEVYNDRLPPCELPMTEQVSREILSLPIYPELTDAQIDWVIAAINSFQPGEA